MNNNIILIGMRGSGKSTIGKLIAQQLNRPLIETDDEIVRYAEMSIPKMIKQKGWQAFRNIEERVIAETAKITKAVIATGGGAMLRKSNREVLKKQGMIIYLTASVDILAKRIGLDSNRPSLTGEQSMYKDLENTYRERKRLYESMAYVIINTENYVPKEICTKIIKQTIIHI